MSDQPKPDMAEQEPGCTCNRLNRGAKQHSSICLLANKPVTIEQECTERLKYVFRQLRLGQMSNDCAQRLIADAHNVAIAAEREQIDATWEVLKQFDHTGRKEPLSECAAVAVEAYANLQHQLAAEREKSQIILNQLRDSDLERCELKEQLVAERKKTEQNRLEGK
jgi:hypothetical protein